MKIGASPEDCWTWLGCTTSGGYGQIGVGVGSKRVGAHRVSFQLFVGEIPQDLDVCHRCDNPPCTNPRHLYAATAKQNTSDALSKGRMAQRKLTAEQVVWIRASSESAAALAAKLGVTPQSILNIRAGRTWNGDRRFGKRGAA